MCNGTIVNCALLDIIISVYNFVIYFQEHQIKMKSLLIPLLAICLLGRHVAAWGGLFNRFSPEMLANMGYGGHGGFIQVNIDAYVLR